MTAPTVADAIRRKLATYPNKHGGRSLGRLVYVGKSRAKLSLLSGAHVTVRSEDVHVLVQPPRVLP